MKLQFSKFICLLLISVGPWCSARQRSSSKNKAADPGYVIALATANRFLTAWQIGDLETGTMLLSDRARHSQSAESVENLFSRTSDRAFEISRGKCDRRSCHFPIVMLTGESSRVHRKFSEIVLVNNGNADWVVDKVP